MRSDLVIGEGDKLIGVSASLSGLGRRLGAWVSEKFTVKNSRSADVSGSSLFFSREASEVISFASADDAGVPAFRSIHYGPLGIVLAPTHATSVHRAFEIVSRTEIAWPIISFVAIDMVDNHRKLGGLNTITERVNDAMQKIVLAHQMDHETPSIVGLRTHTRSSFHLICCIRRTETAEMADRPNFPEKLTGLLFKSEAFPQELEADVLNDFPVVHDAGSFLSGSVIPFVRRADAAASVVPAGAVETSSAAPFIELGEAVAAVVMHLRGGFPRILVLAPVLTPWEEEEEDWDEL